MSDKWDELIDEYLFAIEAVLGPVPVETIDTQKSRTALRSAITVLEQQIDGYKSMMQSDVLEQLHKSELIMIIRDLRGKELESRLVQAEDDKRDAENLVHDILHICQKYQPAGSPPPGDAQILVSWIMRSLADGVPPANRPSKLAEVESKLKEANEDAEKLASKSTLVTGEYERMCVHCGAVQHDFESECNHKPDCPITLHRARLVKDKE